MNAAPEELPSFGSNCVGTPSKFRAENRLTRGSCQSRDKKKVGHRENSLD